MTAPPQVYLCREGLARFCTEVYEEPTQKNMHKCMGHLTNYSLNKRSDKFEHAGETMSQVMDPASTATKRPLTAVLRVLEAEYPDFDIDEFYQSCVRVVEKTVATMAPALAIGHSTSGGQGTMQSMQLLGFDIMLDNKFAPYLLEVNNSPSLCIDEALPLEGEELASQVVTCGRQSLTREKNKICTCMDMHQPHRHQTALVDLHVKMVAMSGAFQLLAQVHRKQEEPAVESYIAADVASDGLYVLLRSVGQLFSNCGGAAKAFTSAKLRQTFSPVCGQGKLEKHDLDCMAQQSRGTVFQASELRLFDFLTLIKQVASRAYPGTHPRIAVDQVLAKVAT